MYSRYTRTCSDANVIYMRTCSEMSKNRTNPKKERRSSTHKVLPQEVVTLKSYKSGGRTCARAKKCKQHAMAYRSRITH